MRFIWELEKVFFGSEIEFDSSSYGAPPEGSGIYTILEFVLVDISQAWAGILMEIGFITLLAL